MTYTIVLLRHGESEYNKENRFCGWWDADLSERGMQEALTAGQQLRERGLTFDMAYTSVLKRAVKTLNAVLEELDLHWIPVEKSWRLNERMYGGLQGLNKSETAAKHGEDQVKIWRRSYDIPPPPVDSGSQHDPSGDPKYAGVSPNLIPKAECLKDTVARVVPYWNETIAPAVRAGKRVLIAAHGNSLRGLVKFLDNVGDQEIVELNIPTGLPLVYELDSNLKPIKHYYLASEEELKAAVERVANQGKAK